MHELPVTERILDIALKHAAQNGATRIYSITLRVGGLTDLEDTWLQHYFDYLSRDTIANGAKLIILQDGITLRCGSCKTLVETAKENLQELKCPHCGATQGFSILSGKEYFIEEMTAQ
jgi:hydrogenase nickel incorporation protein HypA/HybF